MTKLTSLLRAISDRSRYEYEVADDETTTVVRTCDDGLSREQLIEKLCRYGRGTIVATGERDSELVALNGMTIEDLRAAEAMTQAESEGMKIFRYTTHGNVIKTVGRSWEDVDCYLGDDGNPVRDFRGNTITSFAIEELDGSTDEQFELVMEWWSE